MQEVTQTAAAVNGAPYASHAQLPRRSFVVAAGGPAMSVPLSWSRNGLPIGAHAQPWAGRRPSISMVPG